MRRGIVTAGTWCVDLNKTVLRWPAEDTMSTYLEVERQGGGSGCNMAIDLKRLEPDFPVETVGVVGDDDAGRFLKAECARYGILDERLQLRAGAATPFSDCFNSRESGLRTHLYFPGVADEIAPDDFDFSGLNARILHLGLPGAHARLDGRCGEDPTGWVTILKRARAADLMTNLEMVSTTRERVALFGRSSAPYLDYLIVNDYEIGCVAGMETRLDGRASAQLVAEALRKTLSLGPLELVVAHFPEGAIAATRGGGLVAQGSVAIPNEAVAGANGAGDAFAAGMLYGVHEGYSVEASLRLGHAAAAASMHEVSTTRGVASVAECIALDERHGFRPAPA